MPVKSSTYLLYTVIILSLLSSCVIEKPYTKEKAKAIASLYTNAKYYPAVNFDTINKFDTSNYRHGYWIELEDKNGYATEDTAKEAFYRYIYYNRGGVSGVNSGSKYPYETPPTRVTNSGKIKPTGILTVPDNSNHAKQDSLVIMDGPYQYYKKHRLINTFYYKKGILQYINNYNRHGQIDEAIDFRQKHNNYAQTELHTYYGTKDSINEQYFICFNGHYPIFYQIITKGKPVKDSITIAPKHSKYRHDSILYYKRGLGYVFTQNNIEINNRQLLELCKLDTNTRKEVARAKAFYYTGLAFLETGATLIIFGAEYNYINKTNYAAPIFLGYAGIVLGGPFGFAFQSHIKKAVDIYNKGVRYNKSN